MCWAKLSLLLSSLPVTPCTAMTLFSSPLLWLTAWLPGQSHVSVASSSQILTQLFHYFLCIAFPLYCLITNSVLHLALTLPLSLLLSHSCFLSFSSHYTLVPYSFCFKLTPACTDLICLHTSTVRSLDLVLSCVSVTWHANRFMEFTHIYVVCLSHCSCLYCSFGSLSLSLCRVSLASSRPDCGEERITTQGTCRFFGEDRGRVNSGWMGGGFWLIKWPVCNVWVGCQANWKVLIYHYSVFVQSSLSQLMASGGRETNRKRASKGQHSISFSWVHCCPAWWVLRVSIHIGT